MVAAAGRLSAGAGRGREREIKKRKITFAAFSSHFLISSSEIKSSPAYGRQRSAAGSKRPGAYLSVLLCFGTGKREREKGKETTIKLFFAGASFFSTHLLSLSPLSSTTSDNNNNKQPALIYIGPMGANVQPQGINVQVRGFLFNLFLLLLLSLSSPFLSLSHTPFFFLAFSSSSNKTQPVLDSVMPMGVSFIICEPWRGRITQASAGKRNHETLSLTPKDT